MVFINLGRQKLRANNSLKNTYGWYFTKWGSKQSKWYTEGQKSQETEGIPRLVLPHTAQFLGQSIIAIPKNARGPSSCQEMAQNLPKTCPNRKSTYSWYFTKWGVQTVQMVHRGAEITGNGRHSPTGFATNCTIFGKSIIAIPKVAQKLPKI